MQTSPPAGLPRRDTWMMIILLAIMIATDIAAAVTGVPDKVRPAFVLLPAALTIAWLGYVLTLRIAVRRLAGNQRALEKLSRFMGSTLSLIGGLLTVEHVLVLGSFTWFGGLNRETAARAVTAAIGVVVIIIYNRAPKALAGVPQHGFPGVGTFFSGREMQRETAWTGVACGAAIIGWALLGPIGKGQLLVWIFMLMLLPPAVQIGLTLTRRSRP